MLCKKIPERLIFNKRLPAHSLLRQIICYYKQIFAMHNVYAIAVRYIQYISINRQSDFLSGLNLT